MAYRVLRLPQPPLPSQARAPSCCSGHPAVSPRAQLATGTAQACKALRSCPLAARGLPITPVILGLRNSISASDTESPGSGNHTDTREAGGPFSPFSPLGPGGRHCTSPEKQRHPGPRSREPASLGTSSGLPVSQTSPPYNLHHFPRRQCFLHFVDGKTEDWGGEVIHRQHSQAILSYSKAVSLQILGTSSGLPSCLRIG